MSYQVNHSCAVVKKKVKKKKPLQNRPSRPNPSKYGGDENENTIIPISVGNDM